MERGWVPPGEVSSLLSACPPGHLASRLVRQGFLTSEQRALFQEEIELREILDVVLPARIPPEVEKALQDPEARIGRYVRVRMVGRGMGEMWKAWDAHLRRWVALDPKVPEYWSHRGADPIRFGKQGRGSRGLRYRAPDREEGLELPREGPGVHLQGPWGLSRSLEKGRSLGPSHASFYQR